MSEKNSISVLLQGGLGNQLFQLVAGMYLNLNQDRNVKFCDSLLGAPRFRTNPAFSPRDLMIADLILEDEKSNVSRESIRLRELLARFKPEYWIRETDDWNEILDNVNSRTRFIDGYFQKFELVDAVSGLLLGRLRASEAFRILIPDESINRVGVHMRFGDYLNNAETRKFHGLTDISYYINATQLLLKRLECKEVVIVSDDPERAFKALTSQIEAKNVHFYCSEGTDELTDMATLSHSAGIVISNSSFSWWAGWLGSTLTGADVVAPAPWLAKPSKLDLEIICPTWSVLQRSLMNK